MKICFTKKKNRTKHKKKQKDQKKKKKEKKVLKPATIDVQSERVIY